MIFTHYQMKNSNSVENPLKNINDKTIINDEKCYRKSKLNGKDRNGGVGGINSFIDGVLSFTNEKNNIIEIVNEKLRQFKKSHHYNIFGVDQNIFSLLFFILGSFIVLQLYLHTMSYMTKDHFHQMSFYVQDHLNYGYEIISTQSPYWIPIITPIFCGILFSLFSFMIVLLDSKVPGIYPPSPFSPKLKDAYRKQKSFSIDLSYMTALASGVIVAGLMLFCS